MEELSLRRAIHVLAELFVEESIPQEEGVNDAIQKTRARIMRRFDGKPDTGADVGYNETEDYGMSNDSAGSPISSEPLPYLPLTDQSEDGFIGLDPPME